MSKEVIVAVDQGTTNTKAILLDGFGRPVFHTSCALTLLHPAPGQVEQDPAQIWNSVVQVLRASAHHAQGAGLSIAGIAISNQRETAVAWHPGPEPKAIGNAISWQCRRSADICEDLTAHHQAIRQTTGLPVDPLASAGKWTWLLRTYPKLRQEAQQGEALFGNVDAWLLYNLTAGKNHATDHSNASRTGLFSLSKMNWDNGLLELFDIPTRCLPLVANSSSTFGLCEAMPELRGVPIVAMIGDSHAALVGHGGVRPGAIKATYGTGSSVMMLTDGLAPDTAHLARTVAWSDAEGVRFALEGNIAMTGSAVQWVGEFLGLDDAIAGTVALASSVPDAAGLILVPAMAGLGAPYWDARARGLIGNLERPHRAAHLARAALDAIAYQIADVLFEMERVSGSCIPKLRVDGGATRNAGLLQFQADLIGKPVLNAAREELSALGAGWLGGLSLGWWAKAAEFEDLVQPGLRFEPRLQKAARQQLHAGWRTAVARARLTQEEASHEIS